MLGTPGDTPDPLALQSALEAQGFTTSPLQSKGHTLLAWTQLQSKPVKGNPDQLQARLAGARAADAGLLISVTADSVVRLVPPLILSTAEADEIVAILAPLISAFLKETA